MSLLTEAEKEEMKALDEKALKLKNQFEKVIEKQKSIQAKEDKRLDEKRFHSIVSILDAGDAICSIMDHDSNSCSDEDPNNNYVHNGYIQCKKCAFMKAVENWKGQREWLITEESANKIESIIDFKINGIDIEISYIS